MSIAIIVPEINNRLQYICDWIFTKRLGLAYSFILEKPLDRNFQVIIDYSNLNQHVCIPNLGLLFLDNIETKQFEIGEWQQVPTIFAVNNEKQTIPFDIFSAIFYLISRYEEHLPYTPDTHNRYPATASILHKINMLHRPIVDEWLYAFAALLRANGIALPPKKFEYAATFDIDIAWSYLHKGWLRNIGGMVRAISKNDFQGVKKRLQVLQTEKNDPYDSFEFINSLHHSDTERPIFFFLVAATNSNYDKHILPTNNAMRALIKSTAATNTVAIHPSYFASTKEEVLRSEKENLEEIIGNQIVQSRQHYIKMQLPQTYRQLIQAGITMDYSMGYGTHLGFRAGTSHSFLWYDLENNTATKLLVIPFCFMDTTAHYSEHLSVQEAFLWLSSTQELLQKIGGKMTTIFHNFSLGKDKEWQGWAQAYQQFLRNTKQQ